MKKNIVLTIVLSVCVYTTIFAQAGAIDSTFANAGKFFHNNNENYIANVYSMVVQSDGKILMAGDGHSYSYGNGTSDFAIIRLNRNGSMDNTFGDNGEVFIDFSTDEMHISFSLFKKHCQQYSKSFKNK